MNSLQEQLAKAVEQVEIRPDTLDDLIRRAQQAPEDSPAQQIARVELEEALKEFAPDYHRYDPSPARMGRLRGAGAPFLVVNGENRALKASSLPSVARAQADLSPNRKVIDMSRVPRFNRRAIQNVMATRLSNTTIAESPVIVPRGTSKSHTPKRDKPEVDETAELLDEIRSEVFERLGRDAPKALSVVSDLARVFGREAALDLIRDLECFQYTAVFDKMAGQIVAQFDTAAEASAHLKTLLELPPRQCQMLSKGKPTGRYRYLTVKPDYEG